MALRTLPADITLNGTGDANGVELRITDTSSGRVVCEATLTAEQVVAALGGRYLGKVPMKWYSPETIGWKRENTHIGIPSKTYGSEGLEDRKAALRAKVAELKKAYPGAIVNAHEDDLANGHRAARQDDGTYVYQVYVGILHPPA